MTTTVLPPCHVPPQKHHQSMITSTKPPKPRRPTSYTNRTSSINKRSSGTLKSLNLYQSNFNINAGGNVPSPPVSARTPKVAAFTPILERSQEHSREERNEKFSAGIN